MGTKVTCGDEGVEITEEAATVIRNIWDGPIIDGKKLWHGMTIGSELSILAGSQEVNETTVGVPFFVADAWVRYYVKEDTNYDMRSIDSETLCRWAELDLSCLVCASRTYSATRDATEDQGGYPIAVQ